MVVFVFCSMVIGMVAAGMMLLSGFSILVAASVYAGVGTLTMALVLIRALICLHLNGSRDLPSQST
ncbi:hypothetical protein [Roseovarius sp. CAU 1744]|uniref:hypothetical protein n=1 Tax=Roseovarius sp. CAU 1744 TaxID=3140368 RepID=UPI00325C2145